METSTTPAIKTMSMTKVLADRLKELRGTKSQAAVAKRLGISQQGWARYETGKILPGAEMIRQICSEFNISADWLLGLSDVRTAAQSVEPLITWQQSFHHSDATTVFVERLKELRGSLSQSEFANEIGTKQTTYSSWERGIKEPGISSVISISTTFDVSSDWLLGLSNIREPNRIIMKTKFVSRLNELRGEMSVSAFARRVNMPQPTIDRYFKGRVPSIEVLSTICITFGVSADWLLGLSNIREPVGTTAQPSAQPRRSSPIFNPQQKLIDEIAALKRRVNALESSTSMATCG